MLLLSVFERLEQEFAELKEQFQELRDFVGLNADHEYVLCYQTYNGGRTELKPIARFDTEEQALDYLECSKRPKGYEFYAWSLLKGYRVWMDFPVVKRLPGIQDHVPLNPLVKRRKKPTR